MRQLTAILCLVGFLLMPGIAQSMTPEMLAKRPVEGKYKVLIAGFCAGTGTAHVNPAVVNISGSVKTPDGQTGSLSTGPMKRDKTDHFSGQGTCMGVSITITGRIDQFDDLRVSATFITSDGRTGRIVGLPDSP